MLFSFGDGSFDIEYVAVPVACNVDGVRPTIVYSGAGSLYSCTCDDIDAAGVACVGVAIGSPFVGWRDLPMPATGNLLFAKAAQITTDVSTLFGIVNDSGTKSVWRIDYSMTKGGSWIKQNDLPAEDDNISMWDMTLFGADKLAKSMASMRYNNVAFEQTLLHTDYCTNKLFTPWPDPINESYL